MVSPGGALDPGTTAELPAGPQMTLPRRARVGLLLPLTGGSRQLGEAMLNAAQLALFDGGDPQVELIPRDTGGTATGAAQAASGALADGAQVFAGPLTLGETAAASGPVRSAGRSMLAFTSDAVQAGNGVWILGVTPNEQAERLAAAAAAGGSTRFGLLAPDDEFGRRFAAGLRRQLSALGLPPPIVVLHARLGDAATGAQALATQAGAEGLEAVLLGLSGDRAKAAATALAAALPAPPRLLGPALWANDRTVLREPALAGAWFPGPDPTARQQFETRYQAAYGVPPPRLAGIAYDAAALAVRAVREPGATPPIGEAMMGADGPLLLAPGGLARRGLALFELDGSGEAKLVEPAPTPLAAGT